MARMDSPRHATAIAILGSPNDAEGHLHSIAVERCEYALALAECNPDAWLLLTGGYGEHFNVTPLPHAEYLRRWLHGRGVSESRLLPFAESRNTLEDASLSKALVVDRGIRTLVVVTSDYHLERARFVFEREFADTDVTLVFTATRTREADCQLDVAALKAHEKRALDRLRQKVDQSRHIG